MPIKLAHEIFSYFPITISKTATIKPTADGTVEYNAHQPNLLLKPITQYKSHYNRNILYEINSAI